MKRIIIVLILLFCLVLLFPYQCVFAISDDFKFVIDTIGIPRYNVYGDEINEDIYYTYNVFAYSNPISMVNRTSTQRFKESKYGLWTKEGSKYKGYGTRGEYYVLGTTYSGSIIDNVYFPVDSVPETTPDRFNFISFAGALESWNDTNIYKYPEQLEYMKYTQMLFDSDNFRNPPTGLMDLKPYNVIASGIGLNKARLNAASTWKTMGVISTKRINNKGQTRNVIFATAPIAANADIKSEIKVQDKYIMDGTTKSLDIPIEFKASAINLNQYAKAKHIKEIVSILYLDNIEIAKISGSKVTNISKTINYNISRNNYIKPGEYTIKLKVVSYLYTEFCVDGLMKNIEEKEIKIQINPNTIVPVKNIDVGILEKDNITTYVKPLIKTKETENAESVGLVEKGRHIAIKLDIEDKIENFTTIVNDSEIENKVIKQNDNSIILEIDVSNIFKNTLISWNYLRDKNNNYFKSDFNEIGNRIISPNILKISYKYNNIDYKKEILIDTIDDYIMNLNYILNTNIINSKESKKNIEQW